MTRRFPLSRALLALVLIAGFAAPLAAQPVLQPLPTPDLSRLKPEERQGIEAARREFEAMRAPLVGPPLANAFAWIGARYLRYGLHDAARVAYANAIAIEPADGRYWYMQGVVSETAKNYAQARTEYGTSLRHDPNYLPTHYRLAGMQLALGDSAAARQTLEALAKKRDDVAPLHALLAQVALVEKRWDAAIDHANRALVIEPGATVLYKMLAEAYTKKGDAKSAARATAKAGNVPVTSFDPLFDGVFATTTDTPTEALRIAATGRHLQARALLDDALAKNPDDVLLLAAYARIEADAGRGIYAYELAKKALGKAPNNPVALLAMGMVLETSGREAEAATHYEKAVAADPKSVEARLLLGHARMRQKQYAAAAAQYREVSRIAPDEGTAQARLAAAEALGGRCGPALTAVGEGIAARPRDGDLLQTFVRLAATCPAATPAQKAQAVDRAQGLYKARPNAAHAEALAMALAATGKAADAVGYQAQALFEAAKTNDAKAAERMKTVMKRFEAGQPATQPWPAGHPFVDPRRLEPSVVIEVKVGQ